MPSHNTSAAIRRLIRAAAIMCLAAVTALAFLVSSGSLRTTLVTFLVVAGLVYAGWRLSITDDERVEPLPVDD